MPITESKSDSEELIYQVEEPEYHISHKEISGYDLEECSTSIPPKATPVITKLIEVTSVTMEFTNISPKVNTLISPKLTHMIMGIAKDFLYRIPPMRDIQHTIDLVPRVSHPDLPHHRMDSTMYIELKRQVDELSLEIMQQCFTSINIHFYKDKFWSYIVTKSVSQTKDVVISDRSISKIFEDAVMGEHDAL